jgi:hypothetical protein
MPVAGWRLAAGSAAGSLRTGPRAKVCGGTQRSVAANTEDQATANRPNEREPAGSALASLWRNEPFRVNSGLRTLHLKGAVAVEGGVPLLEDGKIIGAIGVSGGSSQQDGQCARAGADAVK